ncbi:MAG: acyl carrier protein [Clostridium sp. SCN 57-10]|nr:MAG: acyl carrier protein [Clostridium sp. SCN 57-10]
MFEQVRDVIVATLRCEADEVKPETSLVNDLGADSLDAVELNMALEEAFGIHIPDGALAEMKTVADIVNCVEQSKQ